MMAESLYCPRCSTPCPSHASFCRACGLELGEIGAIVRGESLHSKPDRYRPNFNFMRLGIGLFILGMVIALGNAAIKSLGLFPEEWGKMVFLSLVAIGMACLGLGFVIPPKRRKQRAKESDRGPKPAETAQLSSPKTNFNEGPFSVPAREPVYSEPGSVTERTTRNLESED